MSAQAIFGNKTRFASKAFVSNTTVRDKRILIAKRGIWLYFWLLIFEGALRKWVLPGLSTPLLIIRDPIALWVLFYAYIHKLVKLNGYITSMFVITFISLIWSLIFGHRNLIVAFYGARIFIIHFPFMFLMGQLFDREDVIEMGKAMLIVAIPMTLLLAVQFNSPQSAWVNRGVGGDEAGSGFGGGGGHMRSSGTFSFTNGLVCFYGVALPFVLFFLLDSKARVSKIVLWAATLCTIAAIPLSISRTLFFSSLITAFFAMFSITNRPRLLSRIIGSMLLLVVAFFILSKISVFNQGIYAFTDRFETANMQEGGAEGVFTKRILSAFIGPFSRLNQIPFLGVGIGMGTNAGAQILTGDTKYLVSEGEWGRIIGEMGLLFGMIVLLIRINLSAKLCIAAFKSIKIGNLLPWLIMSYAAFNIIMGLWAQPTALGFIILSGGLAIAAFNKYSRPLIKK